ncbi:hypothetical protein Tco_0927911 [Tanacetum coccineum]
MAQLKYCDKHNQVGFLLKPTESAGYTEIVDFLRRSKLRYALTHNPPIYDSLVKQFWQTATVKTLADGTQQINATIDSVEYTITEESVRRQLQLADDSGITMLQNEEIFEGLQNIGYLTDGTFTFWKSHFTPQWRFLIHHILHCISSKSRGWDQFGSNIATALICLSTGRVFNFSKLIFDGMISNLKSKSKFLMYPRFLQMILNVQTENKNLFVSVLLTKKIFGNMKRGFQGIHRPLLPVMLTINAGQAQPSGAQTPPPPPLERESQKAKYKLRNKRKRKGTEDAGAGHIKKFLLKQIRKYILLLLKRARVQESLKIEQISPSTLEVHKSNLIVASEGFKEYTSTQLEARFKKATKNIMRDSTDLQHELTLRSLILLSNTGRLKGSKIQILAEKASTRKGSNILVRIEQRELKEEEGSKEKKVRNKEEVKSKRKKAMPLQNWKLISWKLHSSSGVHTIMTSAGLVFHMLVENRYPLTKEILSQMLELKLETEEESSMALELIKFVKQQLEEFEDSNDDDLVTSDHGGRKGLSVA